ncbi:MAG: GWxTD domain-containing protein [Bacteroidetes bacterium]|nr:GWxTD domain-containing protein [Bacteroidota bacterium]
MKKSFVAILILFITANLLTAQTRERFQSVSPGLIEIEKNILPSDSGLVCYLSYRVSYSNLIFVKNGNGFHAGLTLNLDIKSNDKIIERKSTSNSVTISTYDSTNSIDDFLQGVIRFKCDSKDFVVYPYLSILNGKRNFDLDSIKIETAKTLKQNVLPPIVVEKNGNSCNPNAPFELVNYRNSIPFSPDEYQLIIPINDSTVNQINVKIDQEKKEVFNQNFSDFIHNDLLIKECNPNIVIVKTNLLHRTKYFVVDGFSPKLNELPAKFTISANDKKLSEFEINVSWENKPRTLLIPELAIQTLSVIESDEKVDSLLSGDKKDYGKVLTDYWNSKRTDKSTAFNALESEFYKRADYALTHFSSINNKNGVKTDRGKVYIQYGKPDEVKREYSESNYVTELWVYHRLNKEFVFADKTGLGNYTLEK